MNIRIVNLKRNVRNIVMNVGSKSVQKIGVKMLWKILIVVFIGWMLIDYNQTVNEERLKRQSIEREFKEREKQCIVDALYHEARGEGEFGMKAVANVIHNRYEHPAFPDTLSDSNCFRSTLITAIS